MTTIGESARVTLSPKAKAQAEEAERTATEAATAREAEVARSLGETPAGKQPGGRLPAPHAGYGTLLDSVKLNMRIAHQHGTALNAFEVWARSDFSELAADNKQPTFDAFSGWLRNKVGEGVLIYRAETKDEQIVRVGAEAAGSRYSRPANLYALASLTETVPTVTKRYIELEPLSDEQAAWLAEHPAVRTKREPKVKVEVPVEETPDATATEETPQDKAERLIAAGNAGAEAAGREMAAAIRERQESAPAAPKADGRVAAGKRRRKDAAAPVTGTVVQFDADALLRVQSELAEIKSENRQMRTAFYHMGMALAALTAEPSSENGDN